MRLRITLTTAFAVLALLRAAPGRRQAPRLFPVRRGIRIGRERAQRHNPLPGDQLQQ